MCNEYTKLLPPSWQLLLLLPLDYYYLLLYRLLLQTLLLLHTSMLGASCVVHIHNTL